METLQWETILETSISDTTQRLKVPGGWLVCRLNGLHLPLSLDFCFISDPSYSWVIDKEINNATRIG